MNSNFKKSNLLLCVVWLWFQGTGAWLAEAQSNIVYNGSFERNLTDGWSANLDVAAKTGPGTPDGNIWMEFSSVDGTNGLFWQDLNTVAGRNYSIKFYFNGSSTQPGSNVVNVHFGDAVLGTASVNNATAGTWIYTNFTATATSSVTRLEFEVTSGFCALDAVYVGWVDEPPAMVSFSGDISAYTGSATGFQITAGGAPPLAYQWWFGNGPLNGATNQTLTLTNIDTSAGGNYFVVVSNHAGAITSSVAVLSVYFAPKSPTILYQPQAQTVVPGYTANLSVAAVGQLPLTYQWRLNNTNISGATDSVLVLNPVSTNNAGNYSVLVSNQWGTDLSLAATIGITNATGGGGLQFQSFGASLLVQIFDVDGTTPLSGPSYVAQLYANADATRLRPLGSPIPFRTGGAAGYILGPLAIIPDVVAYGVVFAQVRVWEAAKGTTYEQAEFNGGKYGKSDILPITVAPFPGTPAPLTGLKKFSLHAGAPYFQLAKITRGDRLPDGAIQWSFIGQIGSRYVVEKKTPPANWVPIFVILNETGTVTFIDPDQNTGLTHFYRTRLLD